MIQEAKKILHGKGNDDDQWLKKKNAPLFTEESINLNRY
jgi:hypothetical protein